MSELFWPGDERAGALLSDASLLAAMTRVEVAWLATLRDAGIARDVNPDALTPPEVLDGVEAGGNPVIPLVAALRESAPEPTRTWVHRGLTSQDVLDTALVLCLRDAIDQIGQDVVRQVAKLRELAHAHRGTVQAGRTLTQHAVPTTFGLAAARWLDGIVEAAIELRAVPFPVQAGGAAGTLAAVATLTGSADAALRLVDAFAADLNLEPAAPWHTNRRPITRIGDALTTCVDADGVVANDVLVRSRPEIGELSEAAPGGSSTMPHKQNPVLSVLVKRAAIAAPFHAAQLHAASAGAVDERPDGAWHVEWAALRTLGRLAATAASQTADLLEGLVVHPDRMTANAAASSDELLAEQRSIAGGADDLAGYLGATDVLIARAIERADSFLKDAS
jgi:3-carboxy-cis,cis-muconate cycloisomerase